MIERSGDERDHGDHRNRDSGQRTQIGVLSLELVSTACAMVESSSVVAG